MIIVLIYAYFLGDERDVSKEAFATLDQKKARSADTARRAGNYVHEVQLQIGGIYTIHKAVLIPKSESRWGRKLCHYCKRHGLPAFARYKCDTCNLPFCVRERGCVFKHNDDMLSNSMKQKTTSNLYIFFTSQNITNTWYQML